MTRINPNRTPVHRSEGEPCERTGVRARQTSAGTGRCHKQICQLTGVRARCKEAVEYRELTGVRAKCTNRPRAQQRVGADRTGVRLRSHHQDFFMQESSFFIIVHQHINDNNDAIHSGEYEPGTDRWSVPRGCGSSGKECPHFQQYKSR